MQKIIAISDDLSLAKDKFSDFNVINSDFKLDINEKVLQYDFILLDTKDLNLFKKTIKFLSLTNTHIPIIVYIRESAINSIETILQGYIEFLEASRYQLLSTDDSEKIISLKLRFMNNSVNLKKSKSSPSNSISNSSDFSILNLLSNDHLNNEENVKGYMTSGEILGDEYVTLNLKRFTLTVNGEKVPLSYKEFELLGLLMNGQGRYWSREDIIRIIWHETFSVGRTLDVHIRRLRIKLGAFGNRLITKRGVGYAYLPEED